MTTLKSLKIKIKIRIIKKSPDILFSQSILNKIKITNNDVLYLLVDTIWIPQVFSDFIKLFNSHD